MSAPPIKSGGIVLPLPRPVFHPWTLLTIAAVHVYLASGHLWDLIAGHIEWTNIWKGFGALGGAYVFLALASRRTGRREARMEAAATAQSPR